MHDDLMRDNLVAQQERLRTMYARLNRIKDDIAKMESPDLKVRHSNEDYQNEQKEKIEKELTSYIPLLKQVKRKMESKKIRLRSDASAHDLIDEIKDQLPSIRDQQKGLSNQIAEIKQTLDDQALAASAKLEASLAIIPGILSIKGEVSRNEPWLAISEKLTNLLEPDVNPQKPRQEPTLD